MHSLPVFRVVSCATPVPDHVSAHVLPGGVIVDPLQHRHCHRPAMRLTASRGASAFGGA